MAVPLTIRNLTVHTITLKQIERFEDPNALQSKASGYLFGTRNTTSAAPTAPKLGQHAQSFNCQELNIQLASFESCTVGTVNDGDETVSSQTMRLTIKISEGQCYRVDTNPSYTQKSTHTFMPLSQNPSSSYTALFHPSRPIPHLAIHTNHQPNYTQWMSALPDALPLSSLSIPGTHNSHTKYRALPSVRCQVTDIKNQLDHGIRFLDIRLQPVHATDASTKDLYLVHGAFPISLTGPKYFAPVLQTCLDFLIQHPRETVLISLKREGIGSATDEHLARLLDEHYIKPHAEKWYTDTALPYLSEVRGKLVLVRRFHIPSPSPSPSSPMGLDATAWPHNTPHALFPPTTLTFCLQDFCEITEPSIIAAKIQHCNDHLVRAAQCVHHIPGINTDIKNPVPPGPLFLNFLSGSNFWKRACWPESVAKMVNRGMEEWICRGHHLEDAGVSTREPGRTEGDVRQELNVMRAKEGHGSTGIVVMDYVGENGDWELVKLVVGMNMGVLASFDR
jgi:1-phosphatidylinositol phosphodiesterase